MNALQPRVDLDELSGLVERCLHLALTMGVIMAGSGMVDGPEKEGVLFELGSLIEESSARANRLVAAL